MGTPLGSALLGASTFCASQHGADECDSRGLPLTPNSTNITGRFQQLLSIQHPNLPAYLDIHIVRNERMIVVSEWYDDCLENHVKSGRFSKLRPLATLARQLLSALSHLGDLGITHRALAPDNILLTPEGDVKLHNYALYHMTRCGREVAFPLGSPRYMAPEVILSEASSPSSPKVDVWSLGMILLELVMESPIYPDLFLRNAVTTLFKRIALLLQNYQSKAIHPLSALLEAHSCTDKPLDSQLKAFLEACLVPLPSKRLTAKQLLQHPFILTNSPPSVTMATEYVFLPSPFTSLVHCSSLPTPTLHHLTSSHTPHPTDHLSERPIRDIYYLWGLAGGDLDVEFKKNGLIQTKPPVCNLPCLMIHEGETYSQSRDRVTLYDGTVLVLPLEQLRKRLEVMTTEDYYPLIEPTIDGREEGQGSFHTQSSALHESARLPLLIKEKDVEYQFHRLVLFSRLLESYPHSRERITSEAVIDICPLVRGEVWAALLGVKGDIQWVYVDIDKDSETPTDRQIDVDIPRCHQYDVLLSSKEGHRKFKRILKSWVVSHPGLVYWQGLDSLCAPFLSLNFNNEALAFACFTAFIDKYLHRFFLKDNSPIMQEYLAVFSQLIAFHDPELYNHLDSITFFPELYAIPWFLTMFTHILPLTKIYYLWDTMLLGNCTFPLCVGVAILQQLRGDLLSFGFNECILMFSDMPDIDIQMCMNDAVRIFHSLPASACVREHAQTPTQDPSIPPEARRPPLSLDLLKLESSPRISAYDLISLCRLQSITLGYNSWPKVDHTHTNPLLLRMGVKRSKKAVVVDIRPQDEFRLGHVPGSISLPQSHAFQPDGSLSPSQSSTALSGIPKGRVIIVVGSKGEAGPVFARQLVRLKFPKVCVLHGGAGVLRTLGLLSSLHDDP